MANNKISIWHDDEGDYLEVNIKKSKDTYFNEVKKDLSEIIDKKTKKVVGCTVFNFTKTKHKPIDLELPIRKEALA